MVVVTTMATEENSSHSSVEFRRFSFRPLLSLLFSAFEHFGNHTKKWAVLLLNKKKNTKACTGVHFFEHVRRAHELARSMVFIVSIISKWVLNHGWPDEFFRSETMDKKSNALIWFYSHFFLLKMEKSRSVAILQREESFNYTSSRVIETQFSYRVTVYLCRWVYIVFRFQNVC